MPLLQLDLATVHKALFRFDKFGSDANISIPEGWDNSQIYNCASTEALTNLQLAERRLGLISGSQFVFSQDEGPEIGRIVPASRPLEVPLPDRRGNLFVSSGVTCVVGPAETAKSLS